MNEIIVTGLSKKLSTQLNKINKAMAKASSSAWDVAGCLSEIVNGELYIEDFGNLKDFSKYVGYSKATISQYTNAYKFYRVISIISNENDVSLPAVGQVVEMLPLLKAYDPECSDSDDDYYCIRDIVLKYTQMTTKAIREDVKRLFLEVEEAESEVEEAESEVEEAEGEVEKAENEVEAGDLCEIEYNYTLTSKIKLSDKDVKRLNKMLADIATKFDMYLEIL